MRPTLLFALLFMMSAVTLAGPTAQARLKVVASAVRSGGLMPPGQSNTYRLIILEDGSVFSQTQRATESIARLAPTKVDALKNIIQAMRGPIDLVPADPQAPQCADAPRTDFFVHRSQGPALLIGANENCIEMVPSKYVPGVAQVIRVLKGLWALDGL